MATNSSDKFLLKNFYFWVQNENICVCILSYYYFLAHFFLKGKCVLLFATQTIEVYI